MLIDAVDVPSIVSCVSSNFYARAEDLRGSIKQIDHSSWIMPAPHVWLFGALWFLVYFLGQRVYQWNRLRHIAGPPGTGWTKLWLVRQAWSGRLCDSLYNACREYGENSLLSCEYHTQTDVLCQVPSSASAQSGCCAVIPLRSAEYGGSNLAITARIGTRLFV